MSAPELTIVVPTFNERENIEELIRRVTSALSAVSWEMVFVDDDSPDGTADLVFEISRGDPRIRGIRRIGRRGLSLACVEGICSSNAPYVAVMDADLQHDEAILPRMLEALKTGGGDLAIGSRYVQGGSTGEMPGLRAKMSRFATWIGSRWLGVATTDPMSGFFLLRREFFYEVVRDLSGKGFKILLDLIASAKREVRFVDVPYDMRARVRGDSKLNAMVLWEYLLLLCEKSFGKIVPVRFIFFVMMGLLGALLHVAVLTSLFYSFEVSFLAAQTAAVVVAMTANFFFNNYFTYADRRLKGARILRGIAIFYLTCAAGAAINLMVATYLYHRGIYVPLAGLLGAAVGAIWNYTLSTQYAWRQSGPRLAG
jgi:dolichol-phosphate mannosyltransferase